VNLEEEALNYSKGKEQLFVEELTRQCEELDTFIVKHLAPCPERNHVMQSVREVFLWARYCSELNGVKYMFHVKQSKRGSRCDRPFFRINL